MKKSARIVFMGTASFAVPTLERLLRNGFEIPAVVTAPDKPAGRGKKIRYSPVKEYALEKSLPLLQPDRLKDPVFIGQLQDIKPDIQVVVAFRMLPSEVWTIPPKGTINLHASLLPQFRGAAPINHAIMQGMNKTGVTTFLIDENIDTGRILKQAEISITASETAGELHDRLMDLGADLTLMTVREIIDGNIKPIEQGELFNAESALLAAPKIFKEDCRINWDQDAQTVYNFIRGLSPSPGAYTTMQFKGGTRKTLKVYRTEMIINPPEGVPGNVRTGKNAMEVACKNGYISLKEIQVEGKRKMEISEFLKGFNPENLSGMD